jgi:hypothetical protein
MCSLCLSMFLVLMEIFLFLSTYGISNAFPILGYEMNLHTPYPLFLEGIYKKINRQKSPLLRGDLGVCY